MLIGQTSPRWRSSRPTRGALAAVASLALLTGAIAISGSPASAAPATEEPGTNVPGDNERAPRPAPERPQENERAPRVPNPPDLGDTPWATSVARDVDGYRLSAYTGKYYMKRWEQFRLCVLERESNGYYPESSGGHTGGYQMTSTLKYQAVERLRGEIQDLFGDAGVAALEQVKDKPLHTWNRFWQDAAFWAVLNMGSGWGHWHWKYGGRWVCLPGANKESGWPRGGTLERDGSTRSTDSTSLSTRSNPERNMRLARNFIRAEYGWGPRQFAALKAMWTKESTWNHTVINWHPNGPWYGLGQVNGGFIASRGYSIKEYMASPLAQIDVGAAYIKQRYGSPVKAWSFWLGNGWY